MLDTTEKVSVLDIEPTWEEIEHEAEILTMDDGDVINWTHSDWVDLCCMIENRLRRERGLL